MKEEEINQPLSAYGNLSGYANLVNDYMFKKVFGSEECKDILITFLNHIIGDNTIVDVTFLPTEHLGPTDEDRAAVFDVSCRSSTGDEFIIEMQNASQTYFRDRSLFYASYPIINQPAISRQKYYDEHGNTIGFRWNFCLKPVRFIAVTRFAINHDPDWPDDKSISSYKIHEDATGELLNDKLQFIFLELARFHKSDSELETPYDKWMYLLKNMPRLKSRPSVFDGKEFDRLFEVTKFANFAPEEFRNYQKAEKMIYDYQNTLDYAEQTGIQKGRAEGIEQGRAEGRMEAISKMLSSGIPSEVIAKAFDMTVDDVEKLAL